MSDDPATTAASAAGPYKAWSVRYYPSPEYWVIVTYDPARRVHVPVQDSEEYEQQEDAERAAKLLNRVYAEAMPKWRPIETAPTKPGSRALLYWSPRVFDGWLAEGGHWVSTRFDGRPSPTHWQPLPAAPEATDV